MSRFVCIAALAWLLVAGSASAQPPVPPPAPPPDHVHPPPVIHDRNASHAVRATVNVNTASVRAKPMALKPAM